MSNLNSKNGPPKSDRGYTRVDYGQACVGNRWLERSWSAFLGHTTSLLQRPGDTEWVAARNDEYSISVEGESLGITDFGEVEWSESLNKLGAVLVATHHHESLALRIEQTALHEAPALLRAVSLMNHGTRAVEVDAVIHDRFTLEKGDVRFLTGDLTRLKESDEVETGRSVGAMLRGERGLLILEEGDGAIELSAAESGVCSLCIGRKCTLAPSQRWDCGRSTLVAFEGDPHDALKSLLPDIQRRIRAQASLETERAREDA